MTEGVKINKQMFNVFKDTKFDNKMLDLKRKYLDIRKSTNTYKYSIDVSKQTTSNFNMFERQQMLVENKFSFQ